MRKSYALAIFTVVIWATLAPVTKLVLTNIPQFEALAVSAGFAALFLFLVSAAKRKLPLLKKYTAQEHLIMAGLGFVGIFLYSAFYFYGLSVLTSQTACILNYLWPLMLVIFSCLLLKERMTPFKVLALGLSFLGTVILSSGALSAGSGQLLGIFACILDAVCYGLYCVLYRGQRYDQMLGMMVCWLVCAICAAVCGMLFETWIPIGGTQLLGLLWLGVLTDATAYLTWALALSGADNLTAIANLAYLTPFLSVLFSALLLGERITARAVIALVLIVGGILLQQFFENPERA